MLSVPIRWISSTVKRNLPSPRARQSITPGHDTPLTDSHVDPVPTVHADASSDQKINPDKSRPSLDSDQNPSSRGERKGQHVDRSV